MTGVVTDAVRHTGIAGAIVEVQSVVNQGKSAVTDNTGSYTVQDLVFENVFRLRASASSYDPGEHIISTSTSGSLTPRVDFELRPPAPPSVNYAGVWSGAYTITDCRDLDVPGLNQLHLCPFRTQSYQFTLTQNGTLVSGTYKLWSSFYNCGCGVLGYGDFLMSGAVSPDGSLAVTAVGSVRATGVTGELDLTLRQSSPSTITGTGTLHLRFNTPDDRSIGSVVIQSGTRAP